MDFEAYATRLFRMADIEYEAPLHEELSLYDDVGIDSFKALEVVMTTEQMAGISVPMPDLPQLTTLGDCFRYFQRCGTVARS